ncbi:MAG: hypothetical protein ACSHXM_20725, partial [Paraglaciecola sp.]
DNDDDNDSVLDSEDAFPLDATESIDTDRDGTGNNADNDDDGDGVSDDEDAFPLDISESVDTDLDGIGNNEDNDDDNDSVLDSEDAFPLDATESIDTDRDGVGNNSDNDDDGDSVNDNDDAFPLDSNETFDTDGDGIGNNADNDDDNDGISDDEDVSPLDPDYSYGISGKVIDGYINGATVFLDINYDGVHNNDEPVTTTKGAGKFNFVLTDEQAECTAYTPLRVNVPVGAMDEDLGKITQAYNMVFPPTLDTLSISEQLNITPLTSVLWSEIEILLKDKISEGLSCESVKNNINSIENIEGDIASSISNIVRHYNIPADKIFNDFVADNNAEISAKAQQIVKGLKKSFAETAALKGQYPDISYAEVSYYVFSSMDGDELYPNAWYRDTYYVKGEDTFVELMKVSDDLESDIRLVYQADRRGGVSTNNSNLRYGLNKEIESRGGDDSPYQCNYQESITYSYENKQVELVNLTTYDGLSNNIEDCQFASFEEFTQTRYVFWNQRESDNESQGVQFSFDYDEVKSALPGWTDFVQNINSLSVEQLVTYIDSLPVQFCEIGDAGAIFVNRSKNYLEGDVQVTIDRAEDNSYRLSRVFPDGTQSEESFTAEENPTINGCTLLDSDKDGFTDYDDSFPNDPNEWADFDLDGIGNNADTDDDNDGVLDTVDAFPFNASLTVEINNGLSGDSLNIAEDISIDLYESCGANSAAPANVDSDNDGVYDFYDASPNDANVSKALKFNLGCVANAGISESISDSSTGEIVWLKNQKRSKSTIEFVLPNAYAQDSSITLSNTTNVNSVDQYGESVADAILASDAFFVAETIATPDGRFTYLVTSPRVQDALSGLPPETCNLYVVDNEDNSFRCALESSDFEPTPVQLLGSSRISFNLQGIQFRADNTGIFVGSDNQLYLLSQQGNASRLPNGAPFNENFDINFGGAGWLDDEHVYYVAGYYSFDTGTYIGPNISVIDVNSQQIIFTGTEANILNNAGGQVSQLDNVVFIGQRAIRWTGNEFLSAPELEGGGIETIVDPYDRAWSYQDFYEGDTPKLLTSNDGQYRIELSQAARNGFDDQPSSGTGSGMVYRNFAFAEDYLLHKYGMNAKTPVQTIEGQPYLSSTVYPLANDQGYIIVDNRFSVWDYIPSVNTTGNVTVNYTALVDGVAEARSMTIPEDAVQRYLAQTPQPLNPLNFTNDLREVTDSGTIRLYTPEPHRLGFCLFELATENQQCALLEDYNSTSVRYDYLQGNQFLPQDYYECIDGNCSSGIQNLILLGDELYVYFRDDTDGQFYAATASVVDFMLQGEAALAISPVKHTAGESEIMASANALRDLPTESYNDFTVDVSDDSLIVNFNQSLNAYATLPDFTLNNESVSITDASWNDERTQVILSFDFSALTTLTQVEIDNENVFFLTDSTARYKLPTITLEVGGTNALAIEPTFNEQLFVKAIAGKNTVPSIIVNPGNRFSFSIADLDSELFSIDPLTGELSFITAPDYQESPNGTTDNEYQVKVLVSSALNEVVTEQVITIEVVPFIIAISGSVVDSYVAGAVVFQDINDNGVIDANEPNTVTDINGQFELMLDSSSRNARIRVVNSGFDIGANEVLGAMLDTIPSDQGHFVLSPISTLVGRMLASDYGLSLQGANQRTASTLGLDLSVYPEQSLLGIDPLAQMQSDDDNVVQASKDYFHSQMQLMALGNLTGALFKHQHEAALQILQNDYSAFAQTPLDSDYLSALGHEQFFDTVT